MGGGWQSVVAYINLGSYYVFGLPLGILLGYAGHLGVPVSTFADGSKFLVAYGIFDLTSSKKTKNLK